MSKFIDFNDAKVSAILEFGNVSLGTLQKIQCAQGEIAGFSFENINVNKEDKDYIVCNIYDCSSGENILVGSVAAIPGTDILGGMFSSAVFFTGNIDSPKFYKVDY